MEDLIPLIVIIAIFIVLPAMAFHYADRRRRWQIQQAAGSGAADGELAALAERMEKRIDALEKILDAEAPGWRQRHHG